MILFADNI